MQKRSLAHLCLCVCGILWGASPMENVEKYNIVLVHGAADRWQGLDCDNGDLDGDAYGYAFEYNTPVVLDSSTCVLDTNGNLSCAPSYYLSKRIGGIIHGADTGSSATGMVKELFPFLNEELLESPYAAYLQRPFVNPAGSPANNADEIGKSNWIGSGMCSARRSLIEEAKEFKAHGQDTLKMFRESPTAEYRKIASRNILVGHSMGGVAI